MSEQKRAANERGALGYEIHRIEHHQRGTYDNAIKDALRVIVRFTNPRYIDQVKDIYAEVEKLKSSQDRGCG